MTKQVFTNGSNSIKFSGMKKEITIFLTDDDHDDHELFIETVTDSYSNFRVKSFYNGVELMTELNNERSENIIETKLPD